jgi:hypothetical protein
MDTILEVAVSRVSPSKCDHTYWNDQELPLEKQTSHHGRPRDITLFGLNSTPLQKIRRAPHKVV